MKKLLLTTLSLAAIMSANAERLELTFNRTGATAEDVTVSASGIEGAEISAELVSISHNMMTSGDNITATILCPNINANTNPAPTIEFLLKITGLENFEYNVAGVHIHALNSSGKYQSSTDGKVRLFNVEVQTGATEEELTPFAHIEEFDIAANVAGLNKLWTAASTETNTSTSPLYVKIAVTRGTTNQGCFFGLSQVILDYDIVPVMEAYRTEQLAGIKTCPDLFDDDVVSGVENMELTGYSTVAEGEAAIDEAINGIYANLDGKTVTIHNVYRPDSGNNKNFYLSASHETNLTGVEDISQNTEWLLTHEGENKFTLSNDGKYISHPGEITLGANYGGPDLTHTTDAEASAVFAIEPYNISDYTNTVALRCQDIVDVNTPSNGAREYLHYPANFTASSEAGAAGQTVKLYFNTKDTNATHGSVKKGSWVMTVITPGSTAIKSVESVKEEVQGIYDLQGRKLSTPKRGINIINGKKTIIF